MRNLQQIFISNKIAEAELQTHHPTFIWCRNCYLSSVKNIVSFSYPTVKTPKLSIALPNQVK
jgi:hypothetical protein